MTDDKRVLEALRSGRPVIAASHVNPDGDSVGSALALTRWLRDEGLNAAAVFADGVPPQYRFLPEAERALSEFPADPSGKVAVVLDTPDPARTGAPSGYFAHATLVINVDHHPSNTGFGDVRLVDVGASSTALLIHELIAHEETEATPDVAALLYTGVFTDTGGFRFGNTDARTLAAAAELVRLGADAPEIARRVYGEQPVESLRLLGLVLSSVESALDGRVSFMTLTDEMRRQSGASADEIEGLASYGHLLEGVKVSILLREQGDRVRASLRSSGEADVNAIARTLGGGGHSAASGVLLDGPIERARERLLEAVEASLPRE